MTNFHVCVGLFMSLQKILEELWKIHMSLPHVTFKFKLSSTVVPYLKKVGLAGNLPGQLQGTYLRMLL